MGLGYSREPVMNRWGTATLLVSSKYNVALNHQLKKRMLICIEQGSALRCCGRYKGKYREEVKKRDEISKPASTAKDLSRPQVLEFVRIKNPPPYLG